MFLASIGLASISAREVRKVLANLLSRAPTRKEAEQFLAALTKEGASRRKDAAQYAERVFKGVLKKLDVPTRSDLKALEKKVRDSRG